MTPPPAPDRCPHGRLTGLTCVSCLWDEIGGLRAENEALRNALIDGVDTVGRCAHPSTFSEHPCGNCWWCQTRELLAKTWR